VIEEILPGTAIAVETFADAEESTLFPEERQIVAKAVEGRRREFATGRDCARRALERLGVPPGPIPAGKRGEPIWPTGVVGSITHCRGYRACAVARATDLATIGVDAEPHAPLSDGLVGYIAGPEEIGRLGELAQAEPSICWDKLLFSAKEAVYKAWFPLAERRLGIEDTLIAIDPRQRTFSAQLLVPGPVVAGVELSGLSGRWLVDDGLVLTAATLT
jgi:4'-phosphopantetheinyl transferase EntD